MPHSGNTRFHCAFDPHDEVLMYIPGSLEISVDVGQRFKPCFRDKHGVFVLG